MFTVILQKKLLQVYEDGSEKSLILEKLISLPFIPYPNLYIDCSYFKPPFHVETVMYRVISNLFVCSSRSFLSEHIPLMYEANELKEDGWRINDGVKL